MDAHDLERDEHESDGNKLSAFRRSLLEPIEEDKRSAADESAVLLAPVGRSWGP